MTTFEMLGDCPALMPLAVAAKVSGISQTELRRMIGDGRLVAHKVGQTRWRIRKDELAAALDALPVVGEG
jgi:excisionase family DNA binding protein